MSTIIQFRGARLIQPIACVVPEACPLPAVHLRPRYLEPKRSPYKFSTDCDRWSPGVSTAPLRQPVYNSQFRNERIGVCLVSSHPDVRTLADYNPDIYSNGEKIGCGAFVPAKCSSFVRWGAWHSYMLEQARTQPAPDWHYSYPVTPCKKPDPIVYEPTVLLTKEDEERAVKEWQTRAPADLLGSGEIVAVKYDKRKRAKSRSSWENKSWNAYVKAADKDQRDDEDLSNNGLKFDHIINATRETTEPSPTKLLDHGDLQAIRKLAKVEAPHFPIEIFFRNKPIAEAAGEIGITENALQLRVANYFEEAYMYDEISKGGVPYHLIKNQLTEEQMVAVRDGKAAFLLLQLNNEWVWKQLDVDTHGTVGAAVQAFRVETEHNALLRKPGWKKRNRSKELQTQAIKEVKARYDVIFAKAFVMSNRPGWRGILSQLSTG